MSGTLSVHEEDMPNSDKLRDRATRLFAMALKARETGFVSGAELEQLASEALAQAENMDRRAERPAGARGAPPDRPTAAATAAEEEIGSVRFCS